MAWADAQGLQAAMVTLTFPHYVWQQLTELLGQQKTALKYLREGSPWTRFKKATGYQGLIRSLELTYGQNGWHPHTHELWFVDAGTDADTMKKTVLERWKTSCARAGLLDLDNVDQVAAFEAHAVDVKGWCTASDYLAKQDDSRHWGVDAEIAKASTKAGRAKGKHPFALLSLFQDGDRKAGHRFLDYAAAMKGKRQLFWSAGLKAKVGVIEQSDEEVAEEQRDDADLLGHLEIEEWKLIRQAGLRAKVLDLAESNGGWVAIQHLLRSIQTRQRFTDSLSRILQPRRLIFAGAKMRVLNRAPLALACLSRGVSSTVELHPMSIPPLAPQVSVVSCDRQKKPLLKLGTTRRESRAAGQDR
ncbi:Replication protein [compost metagenome]